MDAVQRFERRDRRAGRLADQRETLGIAHVELEPVEIERLEAARETQIAFRALAETHVEHQPAVGADAFAQRMELVDDRADMAIADAAVEEAGLDAEPAVEHVGLVSVEEDRIGLHGAEALLHGLASRAG